MLGTLSKNEIEEVLQKQCIGRIGCCDHGVPYIVPISYAYADNSVYVHSVRGMKTDMMARNPEVCFEVEMFENMANWKTVIAWGTFELLTATPDRNHALEMLRNRTVPLAASALMRLEPNWPFGETNGGNIKGLVYRIVLEDKTGRCEVSEGNRPSC
jgi:nitroimidazol reductase NimA-like FMN-containing flavoprotein (pyridoxamine 5'-phosphate oxidase superfamily)